MHIINGSPVPKVLYSILALGIFNSLSGGRLSELRNLDYGSFGARVHIYNAAIQAIKERPWFGYG